MNYYPFELNQLTNFTEFLCAERAFNPDELDQINQLWDETRKKSAGLEGKDTTTDENIRKSSVIGLTSDETNRWIFDKMTQLVHEANQYYHFDMNGFYEPLQLAEYGIGDFFGWHLDFGVGYSSNRKISLSVQLSDPTEYEGGNLEFQINDKTVQAPRTRGTVIMFPSFIRHRVTKITSGKRKSIVGWVSGQPYR